MDGNLHTMQVPVHVLSVDKKELHHAAPFPFVIFCVQGSALEN